GVHVLGIREGLPGLLLGLELFGVVEAARQQADESIQFRHGGKPPFFGWPYSTPAGRDCQGFHTNSTPARFWGVAAHAGTFHRRPKCAILRETQPGRAGPYKARQWIMKEYAFGIDLGGTTAKAGLFTTAGTLLAERGIPADASGRGVRVRPNLAAARPDAVKGKARAPGQVEGVRLGVPGPVQECCVVPIACAHLGGWGQQDVAANL